MIGGRSALERRFHQRTRGDFLHCSPPRDWAVDLGLAGARSWVCKAIILTELAARTAIRFVELAHINRISIRGQLLG
jgi:hypothetical protein